MRRPLDTDRGLAPYAARSESSRGRRFAEPGAPTRTEFQRDRDRIIHCTAFRRLEYKTQVFVNHEGDLFRTRLTHSIEVAQIARSIARSLSLNEDLVEAISLAHDLGHTPFGHSGQDALDTCMRAHGGFEHNLQSLRVVDELEQRYAGFDGLNLSFETREGILKHCAPAVAAKLGDVGERFVLGRQPTLEAQITNLADAIAYNNHDVDDGIRAGLIGVEQLMRVELFAVHAREVRAAHPDINERRLVAETTRRMINALVVDLLRETRRRLAASAPGSIDAVRAAPALVGFSDVMNAAQRQLKRFLNAELYRHPRVSAIMDDAKRLVTSLFDAFAADPTLLPDEHRERVQVLGARAVADYIAGMTDRFAVRELKRVGLGASAGLLAQVQEAG